MIDDERELLGAILHGYRDVPALARTVTADDFDQPWHGWIFDACLKVHADGLRPDPILVKDKLGSLALRLPDGPTYLAMLDCQVPAQAPQYARLVRQASVRRQIRDAGQRLVQSAEDPDVDPDTLVGRATDWLSGLNQRETTGRTSIWDALAQVLDVADHGEKAGMSTPWPALNDLLGGLYPGQLITVGARPGAGKSIFCENLATDAARRHGRRVLYASLEMTAKEITQRTMAHTAQVQLTKIRMGGQALSMIERDAMDRAAQVITSTPIDFSDSPHQTLADIRASAWECHQEATRQGQALGLVVVDYLQLVTPRDQRITRQQQVGEISRGLKKLARELEVPVVAAAQLNRAPTGRSNGMPVLSDLREAGDIEQDSDCVIFLHELFTEDRGPGGDVRLIATGEVLLIVAKNRQGPPGTRSVHKYGHYGRLAEPGRAPAQWQPHNRYEETP